MKLPREMTEQTDELGENGVSSSDDRGDYECVMGDGGFRFRSPTGDEIVAENQTADEL